MELAMVKEIKEQRVLSLDDRCKLIAEFYQNRLMGINTKAHLACDLDKSRVFQGQVRAKKGTLVEDLAKDIVIASCIDLNIDLERLSFKYNPVSIGFENLDYLFRIKNVNVSEHILDNLDDYIYDLKTDVHVNIDNHFIMNIEAKSYTESAMLKRILTDCWLLRKKYPSTDLVVLQLENALGGDYGMDVPVTYGSRQAHVLMSAFDIDLHILTVMEGNRTGKCPIHNIGYYKTININKLRRSMKTIKSLISARVF